MYPKNGRVILHVDMNSFYASVEMAYDSTLKGKPLAIAGNVEERRGIIVTCSYEARSVGVKTTMPLWEARKLCPDLIVMKPNFERYRSVSIAIFELLRQFSNLVEPVSIDEGYVDISEGYEFGSPLEIAKTIQARMLEQFDLPCSIGIAPNKFLAKTASDMRKPLGITILRKRDIKKVLWPLAVNEMHGVGQKTADKLKNIGIYTIGDLAQGNEIQLKSLLGINGMRLKERANGIDNREVDPNSISDFKSVGNSTTLPTDVTNVRELNETLTKLAQRVSSRLKAKSVLATSLSVTIRYKDRKTITRSKKLDNPINKEEDIATMAKKLFHSNWNGNAIRLLGITGTELIEESHAVKQLDLFSYEHDARKEPLLQAVSKLKEKYGSAIINRAGASRKPKDQPTIGTETSFNKDFLQKKEE